MFTSITVIIFAIASLMLIIGVKNTTKHVLFSKNLRKASFSISLATVSFFYLITVMFGLKNATGLLIFLLVISSVSTFVNFIPNVPSRNRTGR